MPYFHQTVCISPQNTYPPDNFLDIVEYDNNVLLAKEPEYSEIPAGVKRRMSKSVRMAVGLAIPLLVNTKADGILIGTSNGGMDDCLKFLNQIIEYNEGLLAPANFVQSTSNAPAAQIALITKNHGYNITHVHRGLAFENALLDTLMLLKENPDQSYLLGCVDEISEFNYNIDRLAGYYRKEPVSNFNLFSPSMNGTIAGEGAFMTIVNNRKEDALAEIVAVKTIHSEDPLTVLNSLKLFLSVNEAEFLAPDLLLAGENGDQRINKYYDTIENYFGDSVAVARFKHLCGDYTTAISFSCWLMTEVLKSKTIPSIVYKKKMPQDNYKNVLIYNSFQGLQHSFILMKAVTES